MLRAMPVWRRLAQVDDLNELVEALSLAGLRRRRPDATEGQLRQWLVERRIEMNGHLATTSAGPPRPDGVS